MKSSRPGKTASPKGGTPPRVHARVQGKRQTGRGGNRNLAKASTRGSSGIGMTAIMGWSVAFAAVAVLIIAAAVYLSRPTGNGSGTPVAPQVTTPASIPADGRTLGVASAPVTLDLYADFRCSACYQFTTGGTEGSLFTNYIATGKARLIWHDRLMIDELRGGHASKDAANAAWCAADQGKFWVMHDWLYANSSEDPSAFTMARLSDIGKAAGLDMSTYQPCLDQGTHNAAIAAENAGEVKQISATPTVMVNGKLVGDMGHIPTYDQIRAAIDTAPTATPSPQATAQPTPTATPSPSPSPPPEPTATATVPATVKPNASPST